MAKKQEGSESVKKTKTAKKNLVIMESPAKAKTVKKYLGANYEVLASGGHVRDLPKSSLGIDVDGDFEPHYITIRGKGDVLAALRREVKKADKIYLATDPDREGEAIAWHLMEVLNLNPKKTLRITFNEITKLAVKSSLKNARDIDMNLVDAQQARRGLDRMVGYEISPILWNKVKRGLSAGRVQSVALRMICDKEAEIAAFVQEEYWTLAGDFYMAGEKRPIKATYFGKDKKAELHNEAETNRVLSELTNASYTVTEIKEGERKKKAPLPFTTSTLQQEASKVLNYSTQKTMRIAQQLYEGVDVKGQGTLGLITYLRTDSTRISEEADAAAKQYIKSEIGEEYVGEQKEQKSTGKRIQDAHEAIRPSHIELTPDILKNDLSKEQLRLYQLIWKRFVASRMKESVHATTSLRIEGNAHVFTSSFSSVKFDGYEKVYSLSDDEETAKKRVGKLPEVGTVFTSASLESAQHFTQPPAHYNEASLVKAMEETGIGRPSTYAPTITTLLGRHYVAKEGRSLFVTELGEAVNTLMKTAFPSIVATDFTATMETLLDGVEEGDVAWKMVVRNFYPDLHEAVVAAQSTLESVKIVDEVSDVVCELCGRKMVYKYGPHGKFLACPGFPECRNTKQIVENTGIACPKCGKELIIRRTRRGKRYFGCESYPDCDFMSWQRPEEQSES
ncbi:MAG: type I DNA topoisomerase [Lachnospiraceae bacterium]|nr:type I DNA topoisomerase [Lachnospiraceae bacterium]